MHARHHSLHAVLTGDIVNSTGLSRQQEKNLFTSISNTFNGHKFEYFRGDSFQAFLQDPTPALNMALLCRAQAIGIASEEGKHSFDVRISIGLGQAKSPVKNVGTSVGEAFLLSGRAFDEMPKDGARLTLITVNPIANISCALIGDYIDSIFNKMSSKQAEVVTGLLKKNTLAEIAGELQKSVSTIHQLSVASRMPEINILLSRFDNLINLLNESSAHLADKSRSRPSDH